MSEETKKDPKVLAAAVPLAIGLWLFLLALTGTTLLSSLFSLGRFNLWIALTIATWKACLVALFFMHLKEEPPLFKYMFLITCAILAIFVGLTFFDVWYR